MIYISISDFFGGKQNGFELVMKKCQKCKCHFFDREEYNLCPECRGKNRKGVGLMERCIKKIRR